MALIDIQWKPTHRQLRQFGVIALVALPLVGWIWGAGSSVLVALGLIGLAIAAAGFVYPKLIQPIFVGLMLIATPIGLVIGELAMLLMYFGMFLPLGLFFRLVGRDALALKLDPDAKTYWSEKKQPSDVRSYYRQS